MHPAGVAVTLEDCEELAPEEGDQDRWSTAARYASIMLPGIFSPDDPSIQVKFAPESRSALEAVLSTIPVPVFTSDDGLGWVYQFWQSQKKKEVSSSGRKIEKLDLAAYSQLFTEDYMVRFLLENSPRRLVGRPLSREHVGEGLRVSALQGRRHAGSRFVLWLAGPGRGSLPC